MQPDEITYRIGSGPIFLQIPAWQWGLALMSGFLPLGFFLPGFGMSVLLFILGFAGGLALSFKIALRFRGKALQRYMRWLFLEGGRYRPVSDKWATPLLVVSDEPDA